MDNKISSSYYQQNKERLKLYQIEYYRKNYKKIREYQTQYWKKYQHLRKPQQKKPQIIINNENNIKINNNIIVSFNDFITEK